MSVPANKITSDIVGKLWNLCNILKDDGVTYHQYVTELTYLLFLKMAKETGAEEQLPEGYRWADLEKRAAPDRLEFYKILLIHLGMHGSTLVQEIFANASSFIKKPATLSSLVAEIDKLDWYSVHREDLGDLYEGLLEKNANEKKSGAGQYFTPRALINSMVRVMQPTLEDTIQDPAAGTGGFLIAANHYLRTHYDFDDLTDTQQRKYRNSTFYGMEHVQDTHRLALMNLMLHGIDGGIHYGDTLSPEGQALPKASLILTNPPFGTKKGGGLPSRDDFTYPTSNKQFCFLQHIYRGLKPGGRAAVVLPDNVLFESNVGTDIRRDLMDKCNLHTILRLPTGIFYANGVKANVLFFDNREASPNPWTKEVWYYDYRTNIHHTLKKKPLRFEDLKDFIICYNPENRHLRTETWHDQDNPEGRWRKFSYEQIIARDKTSLDIFWLKDKSLADLDNLPEPDDIAAEIIENVEAGLACFREIAGTLA
jgi:type I restriction enzyme M protein